MAGPTKDGKVWRHRVMVDGRRTSGTFSTKAGALAWEAQQRTAPTPAGAASTQTCADAFERYELEVSRAKKGARWEALRLDAMTRSALGPVKLRDLDESHIAAWRDTRMKTVQGSTVIRELNLLSSVFTFARKEWKWISKSPTTDVKRPKENPHRSRRISAVEIEAICLVLGWDHAAVGARPTTKRQRIALMFLFAIETAMRAGEICHLTEKSISGRVAHLPASICKNGVARDVPLSPRALELWAMAPEGFGVSSASLDAMFRAAREKTGIENLKFHDTRHEAITRLAGKLSVLDLARMVGHTDIRELMTYYNISADDIAGKL